MSANLPNQKKLISISEAAKMLGVSIDTVRRWDKSGILHSDRPDGKNRYFSLDELKELQSNKPLSISEAAGELGVSTVTLRRLEKKGLIQAQRNSAGIRIYDRKSIQETAQSDYFLRKIQNKNKPPATIHREEKKPSLEPRHEQEQAQNATEKEVHFQTQRKSHSKIPFFMIHVMAFTLLVTLGVRSIQAAELDNQSNSSTKVLGTTEHISIPTPTEGILPTLVPEPTETATESATPSIEPTSQKTEKVQSTTVVILNTESATTEVNIRKEATTSSQIIGKAKGIDTFEFISENSGWYEIKLPDGAVGFLSTDYATKEELKHVDE